MFLRHLSSSSFRSWTQPLSPTLLVLALVAGSGVGATALAATAEERDQHFDALTAVLEKDFRLTGERQRAAFAAAGYPEDAWFRKSLDWYAAVKAKSGSIDPSKIAEFDKTITALRSELDAGEESGKLPEPVAKLLAGAGSLTVGLQRDLATFFNPDEAPPIAPRAADRVTIAKGQVLGLIAATDKEWKKALAKIKANAEGDKLGMEGKEGDPKTLAALQQSTMLRFDAIKPVFTAYSSLREVISRGQEFGLDAATVGAANTWMKGFLKENAAMIGDWEYNYGDYFAYLKAYIDIVALESVRQAIPNAKLDDLEGSLQGVTSIDPKGYKGAAREDLQTLQVRCWSALMRTRLELSLVETDKGKSDRHLAKGLEFFSQFKETYRGQKEMTPSAIDPTRAFYVGQLWLVATRLALAKGDNGMATTLLGEVAANRKSQASDFARGWLLKTTGSGGAGGNDWGKPTSPADPAQTISIAQALLREANASVDEKVKRSQWLTAATILRGGVLGVSTAYSDQFVDVGPEVYKAYADCLMKLELRYQAALVAEEGLRAVSLRITKEANPWKKAGAWTESGKKVQSLAKNAMAYASGLASRAKGSAAGSVQSDVIELVQKIAPELAGQNAEEVLISNDIYDGNWDSVISKSREFLKKYPTQQPKAYSWMVAAYSGSYDAAKKAKDDAKAKTISAEMQTATAAMEKEAQAELAKKPDADRTRDWMRVLSTVQAAKLSSLLANDQFADVLTTYGPDFWKNPPADEALRARVLRGLCTAVNGAEATRIKDEKAKADPQSLIAAWKNYQVAYASYRRFLPSIKDVQEHDKTQRFGKTMAGGINTVSFLADALSKQKDAPAELAEVLKQSRRAFADLFEPTIGPTDKPTTILFVADTLWTIDEHGRALHLYELFQKVIDADKELQGFIAEPKEPLDAVQATLGSRPELANDWAKVRDLVEDKPGLADLIKQGEPPEKWGEKKRNFSDALVALRAFKTKAEELKSKLGADGWAKGEAAIKALDKLLVSSLQKVNNKAKLAQGYRETGDAVKARELYSELYAYEPENPAYAAAFVDIVLDQVRTDPAKVNKDEIDKAREIARGIRNDAGTNLDLFWQASVQVMELSLALGDAKTVNESLKFNAVNQSGPTADLVQPRVMPDERQVGDDKRVHRARNALAVELATRYLSLFKGNGVTVPVPLRIDQVTLPDGTSATLFVPTDAPKFEAKTATNQDDVEVVVFVEQGASTEVPKAVAPAAAPAPVSAAPVTPAPAPAPAPAPEKKP